MQLMIRIIFIGCVLSAALFAHQDSPDDQVLFFDAKKKVMSEAYLDAINDLEKLVDSYPESRYVDDAKFWIGYCLEKIPERQIEAFKAFQLVVSNFPASSWADDALAHQIMLAEQFVRNGKEEYRDVLEKQLDNSNEDVQYQAAISLGKLGDQQALPALREMQQVERWRSTASELLRNFENDASVPGLENYSVFGPGIPEYRRENPEDIVLPSEGIDLLTIQPERYRHYRSMLKTDKDWQLPELVDFGLWHILNIEEFADYNGLSSTFDRREWLRKFWKENDPTPTTEKNELKDEFVKRIVYAHQHFSEPMKSKKQQYLEDQYLMTGVPRAPWDSRGEMYVKFGNPDHRGVLALSRERWNYGRYQISFIIKKHVTNIYGNGIQGNSFLARLGPAYDQSEMVRANYIDREQFHFMADYQKKMIEGLEVQVKPGSSGSSEIRLQVPLAEFKPERENEIYRKQLRYTIVAFNEDMDETKRISERTSIESPSRGKKVPLTAIIALPAGEYQIGIRVEDPESGLLAIAKTELSVK